MSEQDIHDACKKLGVEDYKLNGRRYSGFKAVDGEGDEGHLKNSADLQTEFDLTTLRSKGRPGKLRQPPAPEWTPSGEEFAERVTRSTFIESLQRRLDASVSRLQENLSIFRAEMSRTLRRIDRSLEELRRP